MARTCTICSHPKRAEIEKSVGLSRKPRAIIEEFGISQSALTRHKAHMQPIVLTGEATLTEVGKLRAEAERILRNSKDPKVQLAALQRLESLHGLEVRLQQEAHGSASLTTDPAFQRVAAVIASTLCPTCMAKVDELSEGVIAEAMGAAPTPAEGGIPAPEEKGGGGDSP